MSFIERFKLLKAQCPKLKPQYITPRQAYMSKDGELDEVYIKLSRALVVVLDVDGTYSFTDHRGLHVKIKEREVLRRLKRERG